MKPGDVVMHGGIMCTKEDRDEIALVEPSAMKYMLDLHAGIHVDSLKDTSPRYRFKGTNHSREGGRGAGI